MNRNQETLPPGPGASNPSTTHHTPHPSGPPIHPQKTPYPIHHDPDDDYTIMATPLANQPQLVDPGIGGARNQPPRKTEIPDNTQGGKGKERVNPNQTLLPRIPEGKVGEDGKEKEKGGLKQVRSPAIRGKGSAPSGWKYGEPQEEVLQ